MSRNVFSHFRKQHQLLGEMGLHTTALNWHVIDHDSSADRRFTQARFPGLGKNHPIQTLRLPTRERRDGLPMAYVEWDEQRSAIRTVASIRSYFDQHLMKLLECCQTLGTAIDADQSRTRLDHLLDHLSRKADLRPIEFNCEIIRFLCGETLRRKIEISSSTDFYRQNAGRTRNLICDLQGIGEPILPSRDMREPYTIAWWVVDTLGKSRTRVNHLLEQRLIITPGNHRVLLQIPDYPPFSSCTLVPNLLGDCLVDFAFRPFTGFTQYWRCQDAVQIASEIASMLGIALCETSFVGRPSLPSTVKDESAKDAILAGFSDGIFAEVIYWIAGLPDSEGTNFG